MRVFVNTSSSEGAEMSRRAKAKLCILRLPKLMCFSRFLLSPPTYTADVGSALGHSSQITP